MPASFDGIIDRQLRLWEQGNRATAATPARSTPALIRPVLTVSRQHGTHGGEIAEQVAERFSYTLLHRDILERMSASTGYTRRLLEALDERSRSQLTAWVDSLLAGMYVDASDYARALFQTIYSIARLGGVVVVGRGANFVVGPGHGFHARIVAPREARVRNLVHRKQLDEKQAAKEVDARDHERAQFVRGLFGRSVDDPLGYDLIANEAEQEPGGIVASIEAAARAKFERLRRMNLLAAEPAQGPRWSPTP